MSDTPTGQTYRKTNAEYATQYGKSVRQIQRWKALGYPLDDPERTLLLVETGAPALNRPKSLRLPQLPTLPPVSEYQEPDSVPVESTGALGISASILRARFAERQAFDSFQQAVEEQDDLSASSRQKRWIASAEALRKLEESNPSILRENANVVPLGELQSALAELFQRHRTDLENLGKRVGAELVGKDEIAIRGVLDSEAGKMVGALFSFKFLEGAQE